MRPVSDVERARVILSMMLDFEFEGSQAYRNQLNVAELHRHATGCGITVDRSRVGPAPYDPRVPGARLPVEAAGHGKLLVWVHGFEGYLDDLELLDAGKFPSPDTIRVRSA